MQNQVVPEFKTEGGQMVMFHSEGTGLPQVKDATVNDRDRMQDLLAQEKYLTDGYNHGMIEASHDQLWQVLRQNFDTCQQIQREVFNLMFKKGWYKLPLADAQAVKYTYDQFQQYRTQFPVQSGQQGAFGVQDTSGQQSAFGGQQGIFGQQGSTGVTASLVDMEAQT